MSDRLKIIVQHMLPKQRLTRLAGGLRADSMGR